MVLDTGSREAIADQLVDAYRTATPIDPLRDEHELTLTDAYAIQEQVIDRSVAVGTFGRSGVESFE